MSKIFFTSDLHFGHDKDFIWRARGFNSIEEMNESIIERWNSVVANTDTVYILGDIYMNGDENASWCEKLNGWKYIIRGNHDTDNKMDKIKFWFDVLPIKYADMIKHKKWHFYLSHYPTMMGNRDDQKKLWNLSGHTHTKDKFEYGEHKVYNVGMDAHNCYPVEIEKIIEATGLNQEEIEKLK